MIKTQLKTHSNSNWFPAILKEAKPYLRVIHPDGGNGVSMAIMTTSKKAYIVELTFNQKRKVLRLFLALPSRNMANPEQRVIFLRFQKSRNFETASVSFDTKSQSLLVESKSRVPELNLSACVLSSMINDVQSILEDIFFKQFVN